MFLLSGAVPASCHPGELIWVKGPSQPSQAPGGKRGLSHQTLDPRGPAEGLSVAGGGCSDEETVSEEAFTASGPALVAGPGQQRGSTHLGGSWIAYELAYPHFLNSSASKNNCDVNWKSSTEPPSRAPQGPPAIFWLSFAGEGESGTEGMGSQGREGLPEQQARGGASGQRPPAVGCPPSPAPALLLPQVHAQGRSRPTFQIFVPLGFCNTQSPGKTEELHSLLLRPASAQAPGQAARCRHPTVPRAWLPMEASVLNTLGTSC